MLKSLIRNGTGFVDAEDKKFAIDSGDVTWGHEVTVGYFSRRTHDVVDSLARSEGALETAQAMSSDPSAIAGKSCRRAMLGQMLFSGDDALKYTQALSGGECARIIFCRLMLQKPNFLILDEPTNHLDLESINALNIALQKYDGTVLLVTHDHDVVDEVATRIWHLENGKVDDFKGPYSEYLTHTGQSVSR